MPADRTPEPVSVVGEAAQPIEAEAEAAAANPEPTVVSTEPEGPPRRGWWQRTFGGTE
jgi:ribonuclease E